MNWETGVSLTFLLSTLHKSYTLNSQKSLTAQGYEGAGNHSLHEADDNFQKWIKPPPTPDSSGKLEAEDVGETWR